MERRASAWRQIRSQIVSFCFRISGFLSNTTYWQMIRCLNLSRMVFVWPFRANPMNDDGVSLTNRFTAPGNRVERLFNRLKQFRRIATRYWVTGWKLPRHADSSLDPAMAIVLKHALVFIPFHYGYWDDPDRYRAANELTLTAWDPVSKQPHYKYAAVRIYKVERNSTGRSHYSSTLPQIPF